MSDERLEEAVSAYFDGDGADDIIWHSNWSETHIWLFNAGVSLAGLPSVSQGNGAFVSIRTPVRSAYWSDGERFSLVSADFDGSGTDDVVWRFTYDGQT